MRCIVLCNAKQHQQATGARGVHTEVGYDVPRSSVPPQRDGLLLQFLYLEGLNFETADTDELNYRKTVRETMLRAVAR